MSEITDVAKEGYTPLVVAEIVLDILAESNLTTDERILTADIIRKLVEQPLVKRRIKNGV